MYVASHDNPESGSFVDRANEPSRAARDFNPMRIIPGAAKGVAWLTTICPAFAMDVPNLGAPESRTRTD
jgi:hypothetical protein